MKKCRECGCEINSKKSMCNKCRYISEKQNDPVGRAYRNLKAHAKYRGKEFQLSREEFELFCKKSEYIVKKGIHKGGYHVDRIDESKGYFLENIQAITNTENVRKYAKWVGRSESGENIFKTENEVNFSQIQNNAPF